ncbi:MAG: hypothetical protein KA168_02250 [Chitinophagales bacterium]|jgi:hypothetical protein|nr:hypothetical protein [Chitinophagales bacterium]
MFINTKILLLIALLLFSGAAYGTYNYWQSNVPPKQTFLLQGFEQTLEAINEKIEGRSEEELADFKTLVEKDNIPAGIAYLKVALSVKTLTSKLHTTLDSLFALEIVNPQQIQAKCLIYKQQLSALYNDPYDQKTLDTYINLSLNPKALSLLPKDFVSVYQQELQLKISDLEQNALDIFESKVTDVGMYYYYRYRPAVEPNAQQLNIGDTLQLKIHLAARSYLTNYFVSINQKNYQPNADGVVHYKTVCNKVGKHQLKGFARPKGVYCYTNRYFDVPYTVEACR